MQFGLSEFRYRTPFERPRGLMSHYNYSVGRRDLRGLIFP